MTILIMTLLITTLHIMEKPITLNTGDITYNDITYNFFYIQMTLLKTVNKKHICNVTLINAMIKDITSKVFISIVMVSKIGLHAFSQFEGISHFLALKTILAAGSPQHHGSN
jgi:hypothetical protein